MVGPWWAVTQSGRQLFKMEADPAVDIVLLNGVQGNRQVDDVVGKDRLGGERRSHRPQLAPPSTRTINQ